MTIDHLLWQYKMGYIGALKSAGIDIHQLECIIGIALSTPWFAPAGLRRGVLHVISAGKNTGKSVFFNGQRKRNKV